MERVEASQIVKEAYKDYSRHVNGFRALPDSRDGLKSVQRRVLLTLMKEGKLGSLHASSAVVGDCIKYYHPHGDCLKGDTRIPLLNGENPTIKELTESGLEKVWLYSSDEEGNVVPGLAHSFHIGQYTKIVYKVHLDNGEIVESTENHPFRLARGNYLQAKNLKVGDSLLPFSTYKGDEVSSNSWYSDYLFVKRREGNHIPVHILVRDTVLRSEYEKHRLENYSSVIHHSDHNKINNDPSNLELITKVEHIKHHANHDHKYEFTQEDRKKGKEVQQLLGAYDENWVATKSAKQSNSWYKAYEDPAHKSDLLQGLAKGRERMFNGDLREEIRKKNSQLISEYNSNQGMYKWLKVAWSCILAGFDLNEINYEIFRTRIYNGTKFNRWEQYFSSLEEAESKARDYNHQIVKIEKVELKDLEPMYDLTVEGTSNFAISQGIFVHNSSVYDAAVRMVNQVNPLLVGRGNFGYKGMTSAAHAAMRYTKLGLSTLAIDQFQGLVEFAPHFTNENDYSEPRYIPTPIPACLYDGSIGIGVGCSTHVPPIQKESLQGIVKALLTGEEPPLAIPTSPGGGTLIIEKSEVQRLNEIGECRALIQADISWEQDKMDSSRDVLVVTNVPSYINLQKIITLLFREIEDKLVYVRDESSKGDFRIVVGRHKKIRRIDDEELERRVRRATRRAVTFICYVSHNGIATVMTPIEMIRNAIEHCIEAYKGSLEKAISKLEDQLIFERVKNRLSAALLDNVPREKILEILDITEDQYSRFIQKAISTLRKKSSDIEEIEACITINQDKLGVPYLAYGRDNNWI